MIEENGFGYVVIPLDDVEKSPLVGSIKSLKILE